MCHSAGSKKRPCPRKGWSGGRAGEARLAEQEALAEVDVIVENLEQAALVLDLGDDQIDVMTAQGAQDADVVLDRVEQQVALDLDERDVVGRQVGGVEVEVLDLVEGEAAAQEGEAVEQPGPGLAPTREVGLAEAPLTARDGA